MIAIFLILYMFTKQLLGLIHHVTHIYYFKERIMLYPLKWEYTKSKGSTIPTSKACIHHVGLDLFISNASYFQYLNVNDEKVAHIDVNPAKPFLLRYHILLLRIQRTRQNDCPISLNKMESAMRWLKETVLKMDT